MTPLLQRAYNEAARLPQQEQDVIARFLLGELESERRWLCSFSSSQEELAAMADEALRELTAGETLPLDLQHDFPNLT